MSVQAPPRQPAFRLTGWHVLAMLVAFFGAIIAVDVSFAVIAYRTHPGEVSVTPYEDGLIYNKRLAQLRAQDALGWRAAAGAQAGKVVVVIADAAERPVSGLTISGKLERPATEAGRIVPRFAETAPGRYEAAERGLRGAWDLTAEAHDRAGHSFALERRLTWP